MKQSRALRIFNTLLIIPALFVWFVVCAAMNVPVGTAWAGSGIVILSWLCLLWAQ